MDYDVKQKPKSWFKAAFGGVLNIVAFCNNDWHFSRLSLYGFIKNVCLIIKYVDINNYLWSLHKVIAWRKYVMLYFNG